MGGRAVFFPSTGTQLCAKLPHNGLAGEPTVLGLFFGLFDANSKAGLMSDIPSKRDSTASKRPSDAATRSVMLWFAAIAVVVMGLLWFVIPAGYYFLLLAVALPTVLAPLGKLYPVWGKRLAGVLIVVPVGLGFWLWHNGALAARRGEYGAVDALMSWGLLIAITALCWAVAGSVLKGALHQGDWSELSNELDDMQDQARDKFR